MILGLCSVTAGAAGDPPRAAPRTAIFAGGCFWCLEADFEKLPGVLAAESGYTAGQTRNPTYEQVSSGKTGHAEAVRVTYDPQKLSYAQLLDYFWRHIDPTVRNRQFCDVGTQYRTGIYWQSEDERLAAESSRDALLKAGKLPRIETEIVATSAFYPAEEYHQDYYRKNPLRYAYYRQSCGRDQRIEEIWGKPPAHR
ncbi:MAG: peptide-methionine (S)-S-oxide reductase MsrA [Candidatus Accumulibacter sp.]|uniref:peptide-methionine (S)-S-oxide reductase MsrA n=1 Tax=Accumulibacter sp. TaxID=2053492 RepID=UPI0025EBE6C8|nr:peptide-methionine (S)-S-oxide reductase MsrA [Accumulibacter sp.]MCM8593767.1 peptide-methionine (S)-S-oxide reductase MsrA [Accumulibacter sp.]MCM8627697.1 peptide-methionine (S)-S-oxide reductase MsrA [Accumulibacter sp.]MDS4047907.1 peptide-methionine (S)-S-oxide reductase MsrA [Accumulibacter sp.]